ncbi:DUF2586 family protein [Flavobacterium branchiarum]|uniref:DUF2586 family protein n=1 Tax=Flavobacterium branchiarum TaxID=1114870 RepID=A0ABV5FSJ0_9FLAO|nr:DUF2586 family protein [Flavobacterium branchiarum]MDN3671506.1 DUF2586 family protein [Flavobacterium branchiarum]MDN3672617.1 DUF2586 family protein [Flavobacterium branchiarum]MDN3675739.1 DUF2586 family protein [Flavobacterium branchiarum]
MELGTGTPKVTVAVASGNLQRQLQIMDGVAGLMGTAQTKIGVIETVFGYDDAIAKGYTVAAEPFLNKAIEVFYQELGGNKALTILGVEDTMTLTQMVTSTNANGLKKLLNSVQGKITIVGLIRKPSEAYAMSENLFLDKDVEDALLASKTLGQYQQSINKPVRMLIEGRVADLEADLFEPNTVGNGFAGVVLGSNLKDGSGASGVALALARSVKYQSHIKIGNGQNGPLTISDAFIGDRAIEDYYPEELDIFANAGYIIMHRRDGSAGYYFARDNMATNDDFRILVHGRIIDKAQRIATAAATPMLETSVRVNADGTINGTDAKDLEETISQQLRSQLAGQVSDIDVNVPTDVDIINTSTGAIEVKVLPLGYLTWIKVKIGLTANL